MKDSSNLIKSPSNRRSFMQQGLAVAGTASVGAGLLSDLKPALGATPGTGNLTRGDAAILRFLAAAEIIETDLWQQYNELGGIQDSEVPGGTGNAPYTNSLAILDSDMSQYIHDNTDDEMSHSKFIDAYLASRGADTVSLEEFRILPSSKADGTRQIGRITNLMELTVNTSFWTRYRSSTDNPDLEANFPFPQAIPSLNVGKHPAIPRSNADLTPVGHINAIAFTAGFHFAFIEAGGSSLYLPWRNE